MKARVDAVGFIGYGSMGSMLLDGMLTSGVLDPASAVVSTRTPARLEPLARRWPDLALAPDNAALARNCRLVFVCVRPLQLGEVLGELARVGRHDLHLVSIAAGASLSDIGAVVPGKASRALPSLASLAGGGVTLLCHNRLVGPEDAALVEELFEAVGTVKLLPEEDLGPVSDITGCGPALLAAVIGELAAAGCRHSGLGRDEAEALVTQTFRGTAGLLGKGGLDLAGVIARVATPGGITEQGVRVLREMLPAVFDRVFDETLARQRELAGEVETQLLKARTRPAR